ncbi:MAG: CHAD domain-containing protein [Pirellulaceae bacterium]
MQRFFDALQATQSPACEQSVDNVEIIHRLRVSCRRASASLKVFRPLLRRRAAFIQKWLRRVRRAAGPVRDIDVFLSGLKDRALPPDAAAFVREELLNRRAEFESKLRRIAHQATRRKIQRKFRQVLRKGWRDHEQTLESFTQQSLEKSREAFHQLLPIHNPTFEELHDLRIAAKRVRYTIETLGLEKADAPPPTDVESEKRSDSQQPTKALHSQFSHAKLVAMQELLGRLNDHVTAQAMLQSLLANLPADELAAQLAGQIVAEHAAAVDLRLAFLELQDRDPGFNIASE